MNKRRLEAEEKLLALSDTQIYGLTQEEYEGLKQILEIFIIEAPAFQKHKFLASFIKSIIVYPDNLTIEYYPPAFKKRKAPTPQKQ